ncbi:hypothetical protein Syun_031811 [Stephania yunnanensis]|uniref:Uncharacterized protein n=1 Tax=Stephania yunnanensis TaxID=152371 RepID=A0AAP0HG66_9MAGN
MSTDEPGEEKIGDYPRARSHYIEYQIFNRFARSRNPIACCLIHRVLKGLRGFREMTDQELQLELNEAGTRLGDPPSSVDDLLGILDDGEAYAYTANTLAPNIPVVSTLDTKDPKKGRTNYSRCERNWTLKDILVQKILWRDEEKNLNATYIISVARKLGCSIFLLPEDIIERGEVWNFPITTHYGNMFLPVNFPGDAFVEDNRLLFLCPHSYHLGARVHMKATLLSMLKLKIYDTSQLFTYAIGFSSFILPPRWT